MRSPLIVVSPPGLNLLPGIIQRQEPVDVQTLVPEAAIKRLDEGIVHRLARTAEVQRYLVLICPLIHLLRNKLRTVINGYRSGSPIYDLDPVQYADYVLSLDMLNCVPGVRVNAGVTRRKIRSTE